MCIFPYTVEPCPVDTPLLWTPHHYGHFLPDLFSFPYLKSCLYSFAHCPLTCDLPTDYSQFHYCGHLAIVDTFCAALKCPH